MYHAGSFNTLPNQLHDQRPTCHELVAAYEHVLPGKLIKNGTNWEGPCPVCNGTDRFAINRDGLIWCRYCQPNGTHQGRQAYKAIITALQLKSTDCSRDYCVKYRRDVSKNSNATTQKRKVAYAKKMFEYGASLSGTAVEQYLLNRGITTSSEAIRFNRIKHPNYKGKKLPCMLSKIEHPKTGNIVGVHRTFVDAPKKYRKRHTGCPKGGGVKVSGSLDDHIIVVTEGIEDSLAIKQKTNFSGAIWATCGTTFMQSFYIPQAAKFIIIAADFDKSGIKAATRLSERALTLGIHGRIVFPPKNSGDWNDLLLTGQGDTIQTRLRIN